MSLFATTVAHMKPVDAKLLAEGMIGARLVTYPNQVQAIMKIASPATTKKKRNEQHGLPVATFPHREIAFYKLSRVFCEHDPKFDVVPETVAGSYEGYFASFQQYMVSAKLYEVDPRLKKPSKNPDAWAIALRETLRDQLPFDDVLRLTLLDFLACSRDRHAANYGARLAMDSDKARWRVIGWDNGCAFGLTQERYHCVAHKYLFRFSFDLEPVWKTLQKIRRSELVSALSDDLSQEQIDHVWMRVQFVNLFPYRMPWVVLSQGHDKPESFPSYADFFRPLSASKPLYILQSQSV